MALETLYINTDTKNNTSFATKLYSEQYNLNELSKSVDIKVTELLKPMPDANLDLVPKPIYDAEISHSLQLQTQINNLTAKLDAANLKIELLLADSSSLVVDNDNLKLTQATYENKIQTLNSTILELRTNITTALTKAINEATEKTALEAENQGLTAQKNALIKQIDTLNNLLAAANASLQAAQQALSAKAQAVAAGGVSTGELATILWEKGDPSKNGANGFAYDMDLDQGGQHVKGPAGYAEGWSSNYVDIVAGPKDITAEFKQTFFLVPSKINLKANETKRVTFDKPNIYAVPSPKFAKLKNPALAASAIAVATGAYVAGSAIAAASAGAALLAGGAVTGVSAIGGLAAAGAALGPVGWAALAAVAIGAAIFGFSQKKYKDWTEELTITIKDIDPNGKTEDKTFMTKVHSYD